MNLLILNREFKHPADGWYQIEAKGTHPNHAAGVVQVIDDTATEAIVNRFNAAAQAGSLRHGHEMLIDHEHFSDQLDQETRAYGWLTELQNRADGIYGRIRWTTTGQAAVDGGDYRFFSTEYDASALKVLNDGKEKRVRPLALAGLTLTNMNNNRGQKPITNRGGNNLPGVSAPGASPNQKTERTNTMKSIAAKLGLAPEASEDAILGEVIKLQNRATTLEPLGAENTTLKNRLTEMEGEQCEALMDAHGLKAEDASRAKLKPVLLNLKNREDRVSFLKDCVKVEAKPAPKSEQTKLHNRDTKPPGGNATEETDTKAELAKATKIMNRASELQKQLPNLSIATATRMAQNEIEAAS